MLYHWHHSLHEHSAPQKRLKSRSSFLDTTAELETTPSAARITEWHKQWNSLGSQTTRWTERGITPGQCLATGHDQPWAVWKTLNRLWVDEGRCKASMKKWTLTSSDACACTEPQTMLKYVTGVMFALSVKLHTVLFANKIP